MWFNHLNSTCEPFCESLPSSDLRGCHSHEIILHVAKMKSALASKIEHRREVGGSLNKVVKKNLIGKVTSEQSLERVEGARQADSHPQEDQSRHGNCMYKEPQLWAFLASSRDSKEACGKSSERQLRDCPKQPCRFPMRTLAFCSEMIIFPGGSVVKNCLPMQEMRVWSLGQEDCLEKEMTTPSSIFVCEIPWTEESGILLSMG